MDEAVPHHHADEHSQGKVVDDAAAQQEQGKRGQKGGARW